MNHVPKFKEASPHFAPSTQNNTAHPHCHDIGYEVLPIQCLQQYVTSQQSYFLVIRVASPFKLHREIIALPKLEFYFFLLYHTIDGRGQIYTLNSKTKSN